MRKRQNGPCPLPEPVRAISRRTWQSHPATMWCYNGGDKAKHSCSCDVNSNVVSVLSVNLASYTQQSPLTWWRWRTISVQSVGRELSFPPTCISRVLFQYIYLCTQKVSHQSSILIISTTHKPQNNICCPVRKLAGDISWIECSPWKRWTCMNPGTIFFFFSNLWDSLLNWPYTWLPTDLCCYLCLYTSPYQPFSVPTLWLFLVKFSSSGRACSIKTINAWKCVVFI